jgi:NADP-dependent 3-hydroxy acid dehydrogenase YdfG
MRNLDNCTAWVSGGGTGIGQAGALAMAKAGATVIVSGRRQEPLEKTVKLIDQAGGKAHFEILDIGDKIACQLVARTILDRHGKIDVLVNNAALNTPTRFWNNMLDDDWEKIINVNINGAYFCIAAVLPQMREQADGLIINITSWAGVRETFLSGAAYTTSKTAMIAMSNTLNLEEGQNGIRSTSIAPAEVATAFAKQRAGGSAAEGAFDTALRPQDLGDTIAFVAQLPKHACINEIVISPTDNRWYENNRQMKI